MIIATIENKNLDDIITNKYLNSKKELDEFIFSSRVYTQIHLEDSFIQQEFILNNHDINDYKKYISIIRPNVNLITGNSEEQMTMKLEDFVNNLKSNKDLALFVLRDAKIYDMLKNIVQLQYSKEEEITKNYTKIENLIARLDELTIENENIKNNETKLLNNIKTLTARLQSVKKLNYTINLNRFNNVVMFKATESMKHMYSLAVEFRNKLTSLNVSSSVLVLLPHGSTIDTKKWADRGFLDLREPKIMDLLSSTKVVTDLYQESNINTFLNNQKSNTLIIVDKTLGNYIPFECDNLILVSVGRQPLTGIDGVIDYGEIKEENLEGKSIIEHMNYYCNNDCISSIVRRIINV